MQNQLAHIILEVKECFDGNPWYGIPVMKKLDSIDWQLVNRRPSGVRSIAVLVQHIINWRIFVIKKLQGDAEYDIIIDGPNDWSEVQINSELEWEKLKQSLRQSQEDLLTILEGASDGLLEKKVPGKDYQFAPILRSVVQHDLYHLGQIALINTMKGS